MHCIQCAIFTGVFCFVVCMCARVYGVFMSSMHLRCFPRVHVLILCTLFSHVVPRVHFPIECSCFPHVVHVCMPVYHSASPFFS